MRPPAGITTILCAWGAVLCLTPIALADELAPRSNAPGTSRPVFPDPTRDRIPLRFPEPPAPTGGDIFITPPGGALAEVLIDINPRNPSNMAVCGHGVLGNGINVWSTDDAWQTWRLVRIDESLDQILGFRFDPAMAYDADGNLYIGYGIGTIDAQGHFLTSLFVARSSDGGRSFDFATHISTRRNVNTLPGVDKWHLATGPDPVDPGRQNVYIGWTTNVNLSIQGISVSRSFDGGHTFTSPYNINDQVSANREYSLVADPAVGPNGELYVSWFDYNNIPRIMVDASFDAGATWGADVEIVRTALRWKVPIVPQPHRGVSPGPVLDVDTSAGPYRGRLYLAYCDGNGIDTDVFVRSSDDHGRHWTPPTRAHDVARNCQFLPWIDVDPATGSVHVVFYDSRNDPANSKVDVYHALSTNGGATFGANTRLSDAPSDMSEKNPCAGANDFLEYIGVASLGCTAWAVWTDNSRYPCAQAYVVDRVVLDTTPPVLAVTLDRDELWPPDHELVDIHAAITVVDDCDPDPRFDLWSLTCNEAIDGAGDGSSGSDIEDADTGTPDVVFRLRAERSGPGPERVYSIVYRALDDAGNAALDTVCVRVPHDLRVAESPEEAGPGTPAPRFAALELAPNPARDGVAVLFHLERGLRVAIDVYDLRGALVRHLTDAQLPAGDHRLGWDGRRADGARAPSGVYFVRLSSGADRLTRKLTLVR